MIIKYLADKAVDWGPVYMVSGTRDNPPPQDNFTKHLYEDCVTETTDST